jgi:hypothetical protein
MQEQVSDQIVKSLDGWRDLSEKMAERTFLTMFGQPGLQTALGIDPTAPHSACKATANPLHQQLLEKRIGELKARMTDGGLREAVIRSLLYVGMPRASIDERGFEMARRIRQTHGELSLADFKMLVREQFYMLVLDERAAVDALPGLLPADPEKRRAGLSLIRQILGARGDLSAEEEKRLGEIARIFGVNEESSSDERSTREATETGVVRRIAS